MNGNAAHLTFEGAVGAALSVPCGYEPRTGDGDFLAKARIRLSSEAPTIAPFLSDDVAAPD